MTWSGFSCVLTDPFSMTLLSMMTAFVFCSQIMSQKWPEVFLRGPCEQNSHKNSDHKLNGWKWSLQGERRANRNRLCAILVQQAILLNALDKLVLQQWPAGLDRWGNTEMFWKNLLEGCESWRSQRALKTALELQLQLKYGRTFY